MTTDDVTPPPPGSEGTAGGRSRHEPFLVLKLRDGATTDDARTILGELILTASDMGQAFRLDRLFNSLTPDEISSMQARARQLDPAYARATPDLNAYFAIYIGDALAAPLIRMLRADTRVELVYEAAGPEPPPVLVTRGDNDKDTMQGYLNPAPSGIDAWYGWELGGAGIAGSDGAGVGFIDIEQGWHLKHPDLVNANIAVLSGKSKAFIGHGTSVLGIVRAVDNKKFCVGIANECTANVVSEWRKETYYNRADAILYAIAKLGFGDVLLIESQIEEAPVEVEKANFEAIRLGTTLGVIIVEPAGNGGHDLDKYWIEWGAESGTFLHRAGGASAGFLDSGAIMVAAAVADVPHARTSTTSYGSRVDCFAWGERVFTLGTLMSELESAFSGTSASSAIVAGAALVVQGASASNLGFRQSPEMMRNLLKLPAHSTRSKHPATDGIGRMPDLRAILSGTAFKLAPDV